MKAIACISLALLVAGCTPSAPTTDPALDLLGDVVRSVRFAEAEIDIWHDEVEPLRDYLSGSPVAAKLYDEPKPAQTAVEAIRDRTELLISAIPRRSSLDLVRELSLELERANAVVSAYRGPRNRLLVMAEERGSEKR